MTSPAGIPRGAAIAIDDMLENCARLQPGQDVLILAQVDGLHGGDNLVDETAMSWIQQAVQAKGGNASVLWIDEPATPHAWRMPRIVKAALQGCDILINHSFDLVVEEIEEFRFYIEEQKVWMVRNFATTAPLLSTAWAQTPYELVSEIRHESSLMIQPGAPFVMTDPNGTHLEGTIVAPAKNASAMSTVPAMPWSSRRHDASRYLPFPEWCHPPIKVENTNGVLVFDCMLSWWSRYIGISPYFESPITLTVENGRMTKIEGGREAERLLAFLKDMEKRVGDEVWLFTAFHFGVHPQASVSPQQCPNILHRRVIDHSHTCNVHTHIGAPPSKPDYRYWMHCTGDIRQPTLKVGDKLVYDNGHLTALDSPVVKAVAAKYPGRPGIEPWPKQF